MLSVIILAAGQGKRLKTGDSKVLVDFAGQSLFKRVCSTVSQLNADNYIVVVPPEFSRLELECPIKDVTWAVQTEARGTGDALKSALPYLSSIEHKVLILCADVPLVALKDLRNLSGSDNLELLTSLPEDPGSMGRIKRSVDGGVICIIEAADACANDLEIKEVFSGIMQVPSKLLRSFLPELGSDNKQGEYYLTDIVDYAFKRGHSVGASLASPWWTVQGINTLTDLTELERRFHIERAQQLQNDGVRVIDPSRFDCRGQIECKPKTTIDINVIIKGHVTIGENCYIGPNVILEDCNIADNVTILSNSVIQASSIATNCRIGPFAHIRPKSEIAKSCRIGSFVEIKASTIGVASKVPHLSYIGDADIGKNVNVGAGVITCNYDGKNKHKTTISDNCFIGAGVQLIAPIKLGNMAVVGAGTCLRKDLNNKILAVNKQEVLINANWPGLKRMMKDKESL